MEKERVFVTGAAGMLGNNIVRELLRQEYRVRCLIQKGAEPTNLKDLPVEICYGDLLDKESLFAFVQNCAFVIHAAAMTSMWPYRNRQVCKTNYDGVLNIVDVCMQLKLKRFVHIGTASSFRAGCEKHPGTEKDNFDGWQFGLDYINSKYLSQQYLLSLYRQTGFPAIIINPTFMIGPYDSVPTSGKLLLSLCKGKLPGYPEGGRNFVYAGDVALAATNALKQGNIGECYIAGGENLSYREFFEIAAIVSGRPFTLKKIPYTILCIYGFISSFVATISGQVPALSYTTAKMARRKQFYASEKLKELAVEVTPIQLAIKSSMQWFKENGYLS